MKTLHAYKTINLKDGGTIAKGESLTFVRMGEFQSTGVFLHNGVERKMRFTSVLKAPSIKTMEKWSFDGVAKSVLGAKVEPDGVDSLGSPSWLLALGMI